MVKIFDYTNNNQHVHFQSLNYIQLIYLMVIDSVLCYILYFVNHDNDFRNYMREGYRS